VVLRQVYNAIVTRNVDDENLDAERGETLRGAIFFEAPQLFEGEYPIPAMPCFPFASAEGAGFFFVPKVGDEIEIEINVDDPNKPYDTTDVELPEPRWRCMVYSEAADIDDEFKTNYPYRMGWKSNSGNIFVFDDQEGEELVKLAHMLGTMLQMDYAGNWLENIVRDKIVEILRSEDIIIKKDAKRTVYGSQTEEVRKDETKTVYGNQTTHYDADSTLTIAGKRIFSATEIEERIGQLKQTVTGSKVSDVGGGSKLICGGSHSESIVSDRAITGSANEVKMIAGKSDETYGLGQKTTIAAGLKELLLIAGNYLITVTAGNITLQTLAGNVDLSTLVGMAKFGNAIGNLSFDVAGNATLLAPITTVGLGTGQVLTTLTAPVVDTIRGIQHVGLPTFLAG